MNYYISPGLPYTYGKRIFVMADWSDTYAKAKSILDKLSVWRGADKQYTNTSPQSTDSTWYGWEFESNPNRTALIDAAILELQALGYTELKECPF
jgi:hypothetical protein